MLTLSDPQRQAIAFEGAPLPLMDGQTGQRYMLLSVECLAKEEGFAARIPGIGAYGEGETEEEASFALREALRGYLETFADG